MCLFGIALSEELCGVALSDGQWGVVLPKGLWGVALSEELWVKHSLRGYRVLHSEGLRGVAFFEFL